VVVTGLGALCALGVGAAQLWEGIVQGRSGIRPLDRFAGRLPACLAGCLPPPWSEPERWQWKGVDAEPLEAIAVVAAEEAWDHAGLRRQPLDPSRCAVVFGTSGGGMVSRSRFELGQGDDRRRHELLARSRPQRTAAVVATALGITGPRLTISTACTSSAQAVAHARDLLLWGAADAVLVGGAEVVAAEFVAGFHALGVLGAAPCAPFSEPVGMTLGEGAAFLLLERADSASARGAEPLGVIQGCGLSADGYHATAPDPSGAGLARAIGAALVDAGLVPADLGYVNAHGTGTEANDASECRALTRAFGSSQSVPPVSSTKGHLGHCRGAAGALELVTTVLALHHQALPPTLHFQGPRSGAAPHQIVAGSGVQPHRFAHAISLNAAFGGTNAAIVIGSPGQLSSHDGAPLRGPSEAPRRAVILGQGRLSPVPRPTPSPGTAPSGSVSRIDPLEVAANLRGRDTRGMDRLSRYLTAAAVRALEAAGLGGHGDQGARVGMLVGASRLPWDSAGQFWGSIRERGWQRASAPAFARLVMNAPAGAVSRALGLRGPLSVVAGGVGSTLRALLAASWMLQGPAEADLLLVGAALELGEDWLADLAWQHESEAGSLHPRELATCVALAAPDQVEPSAGAPIAEVAGGAIAGPHQLEANLGMVLGDDGSDSATVDALFVACDGTVAARQELDDGLRAAFGSRLEATPCTYAGSIADPSEGSDALALAAAIDALGQRKDGAHGRRSGPQRVLVVAQDELAGSVAVVLEAMERPGAARP